MSVLKTYGTDIDSFKPSKTWEIKDGHIEGMIDGTEAVSQAVDLILSTQRFEHEIYSWDYGMETKDLIGKSREYILGDFERRIREALSEDDRIIGISDFDISFNDETATATFTVNTEFGGIGKEVQINNVR